MKWRGPSRAAPDLLKDALVYNVSKLEDWMAARQKKKFFLPLLAQGIVFVLCGFFMFGREFTGRADPVSRLALFGLAIVTLAGARWARGPREITDTKKLLIVMGVMFVGMAAMGSGSFLMGRAEGGQPFTVLDVTLLVAGAFDAVFAVRLRERFRGMQTA